MPAATSTNHIKDFLTTLLKQRNACIKAEAGNYSLKVIEAFNRINKDFTVVSKGRFKDEIQPYRNIFIRHEKAIRVIMFGESARQHKKLKEMFNNAYLMANII